MKVFKLTVLSLVLANSVFSLPVTAAESAKITVKGSLVPSACDITVNGAADFGNLSTAQLKETGAILNAYQLGYKSVDFNIQCNAAAKMAISTQVDNLARSEIIRVKSYVNDNEFTDISRKEQLGEFRLADDHVLGYFSTILSSVDIDGAKAEVMSSVDNGTNWKSATSATDLLMNQDGSQLYSWGKGTTPELATNITGVINISAALDAKVVDEMKEVTSFNTNTTLTLRYL